MASYHKTRIRNFALDNLANPELDIARIAEAVGLSPRYLHRLFADEPMQLMQWIWSERLERCLRALAHHEGAGRSVSAVAYAWGFNDASHFSRAFRKRYGVSPRDIRTQLQLLSGGKLQQASPASDLLPPPSRAPPSRSKKRSPPAMPRKRGAGKSVHSQSSFTAFLVKEPRGVRPTLRQA